MTHQIFQAPKHTQIDSSVRVAPGAKAYFFATTTTTPQDTYTTSARNVAHPHPVEADANGVFPAIYLDPTLTYKLTLNTSADVLIYTVDPVNDQLLSQEVIGEYLFPITDAEIAAGVTPSSYAVPELNLRRYGAVGDNVADDSPAFQRAIDVAKVFGGCIPITPPPVAYRLAQPLDLTYNTGSVQPGLSFRGEGSIFDNPRSIQIDHNGTAFDMTGARQIPFDKVSIGGTCARVMLWARNSFEDSVLPRLYDCNILVSASDAILCGYGAENGVYRGNYLKNTSTAANSKVVVLSANNTRGWASNFATIASGDQSNLVHRFEGGDMIHEGGQTTTDIFELEQASSVQVSDIWMFCASASANGRSLFFVDMQNNPSNFLTLQGVTGEASGGFIQQYGVLFSNHTEVPTHLGIQACTLPCGVAAVASLGSSPTLDGCRISNLQEPNNRGIVWTGTIRQSVTDLGALTATIGTSQENKLTGQADQWTIATRDDDSWTDLRGSKAWTANTSALTVIGALTAAGNSEYAGKRIIVSLSLNAATSIVCAAGTLITGLPHVPTLVSADVKVINITTGAEIAGGYVSGAGIVLPAINVLTDTILIHASYFAS